MSGSDSDQNDVGVEPVDWRYLSRKEREARWKRVSKWLKKNYIAVDGVSVLAELVYKHYREFCSQVLLDTATEKTFTRMVVRTFPRVTYGHVGAKRGQKNCYYQGLDVLKSSLEYENIIKGRKCSVEPKKLKRRKKKSTKKDSNKKRDTKKKKIPDQESSKILKSRGCEKSWKDETAEYKEKHKETTIEWLDQQYEVAPQICVVRNDVYQHYIDRCHQARLTPAPTTIFGRMVQKAFPKMAMRRLGCRGESKYYYMGIDVRAGSDHYEAVSLGRMVSLDNKPKKNTFRS